MLSLTDFLLFAFVDLTVLPNLFVSSFFVSFAASKTSQNRPQPKKVKKKTLSVKSTVLGDCFVLVWFFFNANAFSLDQTIDRTLWCQPSPLAKAPDLPGQYSVPAQKDCCHLVLLLCTVLRTEAKMPDQWNKANQYIHQYILTFIQENKFEKVKHKCHCWVTSVDSHWQTPLHNRQNTFVFALAPFESEPQSSVPFLSASWMHEGSLARTPSGRNDKDISAAWSETLGSGKRRKDNHQLRL